MLDWVLGRVGDAGHTGGRRGDSLAKNARVILQGNKVRALDDRRLTDLCQWPLRVKRQKGSGFSPEAPLD